MVGSRESIGRQSRLRRWVASVAAAAALNVELISGSVPEARRPRATPVAWVVRHDSRAAGFDDREVIDRTLSLVVTREFRLEGERSMSTAEFSRN